MDSHGTTIPTLSASLIVPVAPKEPRPRKPTAIRLFEGTRVRVMWPRDGRWHSGYVKKYDAKKALHTIVNDQGDSKRLDLRTTQWEFEDPSADPAQFLRPRGTRGRKKSSASLAQGGGSNRSGSSGGANLPFLYPVNAANSANPAGSESDTSFEPSFGTGAQEADDGLSSGRFQHTRRSKAHRNRQYVLSDDESGDDDEETDVEESDDESASDSESDSVGASVAAGASSLGAGKKRRWSDGNLCGLAKRLKDAESGAERRRQGASAAALNLDAEDLYAKYRSRAESSGDVGMPRSPDAVASPFFALAEVAREHQRFVSGPTPPPAAAAAPAKRPVGRPPKVKRVAAVAAAEGVDAAELQLIMAVARRLVKDRSNSPVAEPSSDDIAAAGAAIALVDARRSGAAAAAAPRPAKSWPAAGAESDGGSMVEVEVVQRSCGGGACEDLRAVQVLPVAAASSVGASSPAVMRFGATQGHCSGAVILPHLVPAGIVQP
eukprot:TRINITY_DN10702_c0_g1_i1.p1 TRINITY_DN10702_c0_g1~~TRINITY_DN10702_c0_g1_i1.p1  ORF type:complete len:542 (-),score=-31.20 TRINITY_DN10702_c0_g1_i1:325-1800(-)